MKKQNDRKLSEVLQEFVQTKKIRRGYTEANINELWEKTMGPYINRYTQKLAYRGGVLYVTLTSAALRKELSMEKTKIRQLLNSSLRSSTIRDVVFS